MHARMLRSAPPPPPPLSSATDFQHYRLCFIGMNETEVMLLKYNLQTSNDVFVVIIISIIVVVVVL